MIQLLFFWEQKKQNSTTQLLVVNLRFHSESNKLAFSKLGHYLIFSAVFNELTLTALLMSFFSILLKSQLLLCHDGFSPASHLVCDFIESLLRFLLSSV